MEQKQQPAKIGLGCIHLGLISLSASAVGAIIAAIVLVLESVHSRPAPLEVSYLANAVPAVFLVAFVAVVTAIPTGLMIGVPLLSIFGPKIQQHRILFSLMLSLIGLIGGCFLLIFLVGGDSSGTIGMIFGAIVGGSHGILYPTKSGSPRLDRCFAILACIAAIPAMTYIAEDALNLYDSRKEYEQRCADVHDTMAFEADRQALERRGRPIQRTGEWVNQRRWRSLYRREDAIVLDDKRVLLAQDFAYVPSGISGFMTGGRRIERHCLSEKEGPSADRLRRIGLGVAPRLIDFAD